MTIRYRDLVAYVGGAAMQKFGRPSLFSTPTHTRAGAHATILRSGAWSPVESGGLRTEWADLDGDGILESCILLIEPARTNELTQSEDLTHADWTETNCTTSGNADDGPTETAVADRIIEANDTNQQHHVNQNITGLTASGTFTIAGYLAAGTRNTIALHGVDASGNGFGHIWDLSDGTSVGDFTANLGSVARAVIRPVISPWYYCEVVGDLGSAATAMDVRVQLTDGASVIYSGDGATYGQAWNINAFDASSSVVGIPTGAAAVTTVQDRFTVPCAVRPPFSIYLRLQERGAVFGADFTRLMQYGTVTADGRLAIMRASTGDVYVAQHHPDASTASTSTLGSAPTLGDLVELLATVGADGAAQLAQSVNAGAITTATAGSAVGVHASYPNATSSWGHAHDFSLAEPLALHAGIIARGAQTILDFREWLP